MPQIIKIGAFVVYFWIGEGEPLEPIHVHIHEGVPAENATKVWITRSGKTIVANNNSKIPDVTLRKLIKVIEANSDLICQKWSSYFDEISYYC